MLRYVNFANPPARRRPDDRRECRLVCCAEGGQKSAGEVNQVVAPRRQQSYRLPLELLRPALLTWISHRALQVLMTLSERSPVLPGKSIRPVVRDGGRRLVVDNPLWEVTREGRAAALGSSYMGLLR
jgi:hypothetical protein